MNGYALTIPIRFLAMVLGTGAGYGRNIRCLWSRWLSTLRGKMDVGAQLFLLLRKSVLK